MPGEPRLYAHARQVELLDAIKWILGEANQDSPSIDRIREYAEQALATDRDLSERMQRDGAVGGR